MIKKLVMAEMLFNCEWEDAGLDGGPVPWRAGGQGRTRRSSQLHRGESLRGYHTWHFPLWAFLTP